MYRIMKANIIARSLLLLSLTGGMLVACGKDEDKIVLTPSALSTPTASQTAVMVTREALATSDAALTLSWSKAQFGSDLVAAVYEVLVSPVGSSEEPIIFSPASGSLTYNFTAKQLNELVLESFKLSAGVATDFNFVLRSYPLGTVDKTTANTSTSAPVVVSLTGLQVEEPVIVPREYTGVNYYFVGNVFPPVSWVVELFDYPLFRDTPTSTTYTYTGKFAAGAFKVKTADKNTWSDTNGLAYGLLDAAVSANGGASDFKVASAGFYTLRFSTSEYSLTAYTEDTNVTYAQIGLIGTAVGGWNTDKVLLKPTSYDPHIWVAKRVTLTAGELKFRSNGSWESPSWGGKQDLFPASTATLGGNNISVSAEQAGTYNVYFNDLTKHFLFEQYRK